MNVGTERQVGLRVRYPNGTHKWVALEQEPFVIGRASDAALQLRDRTVAWRQLELRDQDGAIYLVDLGSGHETLVDSLALAEKEVRRVALGTVVQIGPFVLELESLTAQEQSAREQQASPESAVDEPRAALPKTLDLNEPVAPQAPPPLGAPEVVQASVSEPESSAIELEKPPFAEFLEGLRGVNPEQVEVSVEQTRVTLRPKTVPPKTQNRRLPNFRQKPLPSQGAPCVHLHGGVVRPELADSQFLSRGCTKSAARGARSSCRRLRGREGSCRSTRGPSSATLGAV